MRNKIVVLVTDYCSPESVIRVENHPSAVELLRDNLGEQYVVEVWMCGVGVKDSRRHRFFSHDDRTFFSGKTKNVLSVSSNMEDVGGVIVLGSTGGHVVVKSIEFQTIVVDGWKKGDYVLGLSCGAGLASQMTGVFPDGCHFTVNPNFPYDEANGLVPKQFDVVVDERYRLVTATTTSALEWMVYSFTRLVKGLASPSSTKEMVNIVGEPREVLPWGVLDKNLRYKLFT